MTRRRRRAWARRGRRPPRPRPLAVEARRPGRVRGRWSTSWPVPERAPARPPPPDVLASGLGALGPLHGVAQSAPPHLLVAAWSARGRWRRPIGSDQHRRRSVERAGQAVGRLVEHDRAALAGQLGQALGGGRRRCGAGTPPPRSGPVGSPLTTSAARAADGPGTASRRGRRRRRHRRAARPGPTRPACRRR